jgi:hypothetical protein
VADFFLLGFLGGHPAEEPYITASRLASVFYFGFFIVILPLTSMLEQIIVTEMITEHQMVKGSDLTRYKSLSPEARRQSAYDLSQTIQADLQDLQS